MSLWVIVLFLVLLGGLIAYAGDVIGRRVGRRHLRLFGLRPRATGLLVAVLSGMVVALVVFAAFMLLVRGARETILEAEKVRKERDVLLVERAELVAERERLAEQVANLKAQAARAFAEEERLRARERELSERLAANEERLRRLEEERKALEKELAEAKRALAERSSRLRALEAEARAAQGKLERLEAQERALREELKSLSAARDDAERRAKQAMDALAELKATQARLAAEVLELERRYRTLQGDLAELNALRSELEKRNAALKNENEALARLLDESRLEAARLKGQVAELVRKGSQIAEGFSRVVEGEVLAEVFLSYDEDPEAELARAVRQAQSRAKIMGLPPLSPLAADTRGWQGPGLILVVVEGVGPDGRLRARARFVPSRTLFEPGEVVAKAELPPDPGRALEALVRLRREAEERLLGLGVPAHHLLRSRIPDRELVAFAEAHRGERVVAAVVAGDLLTTTGPIRLGLVALSR